VEIKVKKLNENAILPSKAHTTDSGWDLYSLETTTLAPNKVTVVKTGLAFQLPRNHELQVRPRSGVSTKTPFQVILGTVDQSYTGECSIMVYNTSNETIALNGGYKLAQAVLAPVVESTICVVTELTETVRGSKGFGSSGV